MTSITEAYGGDMNIEDMPVNLSFNNTKVELMRITEEFEILSEKDEENVENIDIDLEDLNEKILNLKKIITEKYDEYTIINKSLERMSAIHQKYIDFTMIVDDYNVNSKTKLELKPENEEFKDKLLELKEENKKKRNTLNKLLSVSYNVAGIGMLRACPVCLSKEVNYAIVPCGHTFCEECLSKTKTPVCCICRSTYSAQPLKLFYC